MVQYVQLCIYLTNPVKNSCISTLKRQFSLEAFFFGPVKVVRYSPVGIYFVQSQQWKHEDNGFSSKLIMKTPERLQWRFNC